MLMEIIAILGIQVIFTNNITSYCGVHATSGCYYSSGQIYISNYTENKERTLSHELGHAIFFRNKQAVKMIKDYEPIKEMQYSVKYKYYNDEKLADYFSAYITDSMFQFKHPCLYIYFRDHLQKILNK